MHRYYKEKRFHIFLTWNMEKIFLWRLESMTNLKAGECLYWGEIDQEKLEIMTNVFFCITTKTKCVFYCVSDLCIKEKFQTKQCR